MANWRFLIGGTAFGHISLIFFLCIIFMGFPGKVFTESKRFHRDTRNGNFRAIFLTCKRGGVKFWGHLWVKSLPIFPERESHSIPRQIFYLCAKFRRNISCSVFLMNIYMYKRGGHLWIYVWVKCGRCRIVEGC